MKNNEKEINDFRNNALTNSALCSIKGGIIKDDPNSPCGNCKNLPNCPEGIFSLSLRQLMDLKVVPTPKNPLDIFR